MDSLKKQTAKKEEEVEEKPPDPEFEVELILSLSDDDDCLSYKTNDVGAMVWLL